MPSTSRQRDRDSVGEIERWRERERDRERDGKGQGNSERRRDCADPKCCSKIYPLSHLSLEVMLTLLHREMGRSVLAPYRVDIGHSLDQQNVVGVMSA